MGFTKHRKYTNKNFKDNFVNLASNSTQKGHLTNQERSADDNQTVSGILKHVIIDRIDTNGWIVEVGSGSNSSTYACTNPNPFLTLPDSTKTNTMYVPKNKTHVEISIDKQTKIYTILRVIGATSVLSNYQDTLKISIDQNNKTNKDIVAGIQITRDDIKLEANSITLKNANGTVDLIAEQETQANQIQVLVNENILLKEKINNIENQLQKGEE